MYVIFCNFSASINQLTTLNLKEIIKVLDFGSLVLHKNIMIATMNEGVLIGLQEHLKIKQIIDDHFKDKKFVYISNRKYSYAVDPVVYFEVLKIKNLLGEAMVIHPKPGPDTYSIENRFFDRPFQRFDSLEKAITWANALMNEK